MKIIRTWRGWEPYKCTEKEIKRWLLSDFEPVSREYALKIIDDPYSSTIYAVHDKPKRCTLTITYEVKE